MPSTSVHHTSVLYTMWIHITHHMSHIAHHTSCITHHTSHIKCHTSHFTLHTSHITCHTSHITLHAPHITYHTSHFTLHTSHITLHASRITHHASRITLCTSHKHALHITHFHQATHCSVLCHISHALTGICVQTLPRLTHACQHMRADRHGRHHRGLSWNGG